ncbi:MAG: CBS domain-containing protein [Chloroflexota bacterium]
MKVRDLMSSPAVTVEATTPIAEVARTMLDRGLSGLPVVDESGHMIGMITQRDVVTKHAHPHVPLYLGILGGILPIDTRGMDAEVRQVLAVTARELMNENPKTIDADADVTDVADLMVDAVVNPVPVTSASELVGVISESDVMHLVLAEEADGSPD